VRPAPPRPRPRLLPELLQARAPAARAAAAAARAAAREADAAVHALRGLAGIRGRRPVLHVRLGDAVGAGARSDEGSVTGPCELNAVEAALVAFVAALDDAAREIDCPREQPEEDDDG
jgi:hypothetical protein